MDYERFKEEVLAHLKEEEGFEYNVFDCSIQAMGHRVQVPYRRLNVVEGAYSTHPYFGEYYDLAFFLEIDSKEQVERLAKRGGEEKLKRFINEWIPKELAYFEAFNIRRKCEVLCVN